MEGDNRPQQYSQEFPHMTLGEWLITYLILMIPFANIVMMFVWAFGSNVNPSKKTFFQAQLIVSCVILVLYIVIFAAIIGPLMANLGNSIH